jgi:hypothetical protein
MKYIFIIYDFSIINIDFFFMSLVDKGIDNRARQLSTPEALLS